VGRRGDAPLFKMPRGKANPPRIIDLEGLARGYTEASIRRLGGYATSPKTQPMVAIKAIELLLERGHGRVAQSHQLSGANGSSVIVQLIYPERTK
jgi:hypothetical protein